MIDKNLLSIVDEYIATPQGDIIYLLYRAPEVIIKPEINIMNPKTKYTGSCLLGSYYPDVGRAVILILGRGFIINEIISLHFRSRKSFIRLSKRYE